MKTPSGFLNDLPNEILGIFIVMASLDFAIHVFKFLNWAVAHVRIV